MPEHRVEGTLAISFAMLSLILSKVAGVCSLAPVMTGVEAVVVLISPDLVHRHVNEGLPWRHTRREGGRVRVCVLFPPDGSKLNPPFPFFFVF